jgi:hypothetical protein
MQIEGLGQAGQAGKLPRVGHHRGIDDAQDRVKQRPQLVGLTLLADQHVQRDAQPRGSGDAQVVMQLPRRRQLGPGRERKVVGDGQQGEAPQVVSGTGAEQLSLMVRAEYAQVRAAPGEIHLQLTMGLTTHPIERQRAGNPFRPIPLRRFT